MFFQGLIDSLLHYLRDEGGFLGLGGDKTTTSTSTLSQEDAEYLRQMRASGTAGQDIATGGGPWAPGVDPMSQQAAGQYGDIYGGYSGMASQYGDMAGQAYGNAMGMGLSGLGAYSNPMMQNYISGTDPQYQQRLAEAMSAGGTLASAPGQAAGANVRGELFRSNLMGNVMSGRQAELGGMQYGMTRDAAGMLMSDRARMGQLGGQFGGMALSGLGGMQGISRDQAMMGDYFRGVRGEQARDEFGRHAAGQQLAQGAYGGPISQTQTDVEEGGGWLGDVLGLAGMAGGMILGGPAGAAAGSQLSSLGGGGGPQPMNVMNPQSNLFNFGGGPDYSQMYMGG